MIKRLIKRNLIHIYFYMSLSICITGYLIVHSTLFSKKTEILAFGVAFDITITIPLIYLLFAGIRNLPKFYIIPISVMTLILAHFILPREYHQYLSSLKKGIILIHSTVVVHFCYQDLNQVLLQNLFWLFLCLLIG